VVVVGLRSFLKISTTKVKGWITKIQFQRRKLTREDTSSTFHQIAL
jgi:hypothetical protein